ncbi:MAG: hypothetical protein M0D55_15730 [Elusimicrobiota bacterium]|nr:MAG: hypothetical protein M0D55_15730 [Elusimicrobiota bacterium]
MTDRPVSTRPTFFHPASGAAILAVDWACFGLEWSLGPASVVVMSFAAFAIVYSAILTIQSRLRGDPPRLARAKAFAGALAAAIPFPITGTIAGGLILVLSGLGTPKR